MSRFPSYQVQDKKRKLAQTPEYPEIPDNMRMKMGDPPLSASMKITDPPHPDAPGMGVVRQIGEARLMEKRPPTPLEMPATRSVSNVPEAASNQQAGTDGYTPRDVEITRRRLLMDRRRAAIAASNASAAGDTAGQAAAIADRRALENDILPLDMTARKEFVNPASPDAAAARERLRIAGQQELERQLAEASKTPKVDYSYQAGAAGAPPNMLTPGMSPQTELMRQQTLNLAGRDPTIAGTGFDARVTSPAEEARSRADIERAQRVASIQDRQAKLNQDLAPATEQELADANRRFSEQADISGAYADRAKGVMDREMQRRKFGQEIASKQQELVRSGIEGQIEQNKTGGIKAQTDKILAEAALARAKSGAADEGRVSDINAMEPNNMEAKKAIGILEGELANVFNPGALTMSTPEYRSRTSDEMFNRLRQYLPTLTPAQKYEYKSRLMDIRLKIQQMENPVNMGRVRRFVDQIKSLMGL